MNLIFLGYHMSFLCKRIRNEHILDVLLLSRTQEKGGVSLQGQAHLDEGQPIVCQPPSILCVQCNTSTTSLLPALESDPGNTTGRSEAHQHYYIIIFFFFVLSLRNDSMQIYYRNTGWNQLHVLINSL